MSDTEDPIYEQDMSRENAILLLAAAVELGYTQDVVRVTDQGFTAPADVMKKADTAAFKKKVDTSDTAKAPEDVREGDQPEGKTEKGGDN